MDTKRLLSTVIFLFLAEGVLFGRVLWLQTAKWREYKEKVTRQATCVITIRPKRGRIYDRNFNILSTSLKTKSLYTIPKNLKNPDKTARELAREGFSPYASNRAKFKKHPDFVWIKRHTKRSSKLNEIYISEDSKRVYPLKVASPLVGKTDGYGNGVSGIEYKFDKFLKGTPYKIKMGKTPAGKIYPYPPYGIKDVKRGCDIVLSIDAAIQSIIEEELKKGVEKFNAKGGCVIVLNPRTGEIYGMASSGGRGNRVVEDQYEPGSTFKILALSCILEDTLFNFDTIVEDGRGECTVQNKVIRDHKEHGPLTLLEAVARSSSVGFVNIANIVGKEKIYKKAILFGFGQKTGIKLPAEAKGSLSHPSQWDSLTLANISFGQGISCTFLQMAMAFGCIANEGILIKPQIVKQIVDEDRNILHQVGTEKIRRVLIDSIAELETELLREVIRNGTGILANIEGLDIAGKTGTAQKYKKGGYTEDYISSFFGFFPAYNPSFLIGIMIDEPEKIHFGSLVAAPIFRKIALRIISMPCFLKIS